MKTKIIKTLESLNIHINTNTDIDSVYDLLEHHKLYRVSNHTKRVVEFAVVLGRRYDIPLGKVRTAAILHDISGIVPNDTRIIFCELTDIDLLKEEINFPMLTHQKVSRKIAEDIYLINDLNVLSAIGCHTTLISNPSLLDLIVFISDKIEWDQDGEPPYKFEMLKALDHSLEASALCYINFMLNEGSLKVPHPWLLEAKDYLINLLPIKANKG